MSRLPSMLMSLALAATAAGLGFVAASESTQGGPAVGRGPHKPEVASSILAPATIPTPAGAHAPPAPGATELREVLFCGDGCDVDIGREFPCVCHEVP